MAADGVVPNNERLRRKHYQPKPENGSEQTASPQICRINDGLDPRTAKLKCTSDRRLKSV